MRRGIFTPDETGGYSVEMPSLPGCISEGDTFEEALANIREAMQGWLEVSTECGNDIPAEDWPNELWRQAVVVWVEV